MCQALPTGGFKWVKDIHLLNLESIANKRVSSTLQTPLQKLEQKIKSYDKDSSKGYILEVC